VDTSGNVLSTVTITPGTCPSQNGTAPPTTDLAESIRDFNIEFLHNGAGAGGAARDVNDPAYVVTGLGSLLLQADGATQVRLTRTIPGAGWNLASINTITFGLTIDFPGSAWLAGSPYVKLTSASGGTLTLIPRSNVALNADQIWLTLNVPVAGNSTWQANTTGQFDLHNVTQLQISFDSGVTGWDLLFDSLFLK
jgi:hypothetical protein